MHEARIERLNCIEIYTISLSEVSASFEQTLHFLFSLYQINAEGVEKDETILAP